MASTRPVSATTCCLAYLASCASIAVVFSPYGRLHADPYYNGLGAHVVATLVIYAFSFVCSNTSVYDPAWCVFPIALGAGWMAASDASAPSTRGWCAFALLWVWYWRYNWSWPWDGWTKGIETEDWRYIDIAKATGSGTALYWIASLVSLHMTPTLLVFVGVAPLEKVWTQRNAPASALGQTDFIGITVALAAISIQAIADTQMARFREQAYAEGTNLNTASSSKKVCRDGLWGWSRHPNYFGEASFWLGMGIIGFAEDPTRPWTEAWMGSTIIFVFFRISAHLMDQRNLAHREGYDIVMREVSALVPLPPFGSRSATAAQKSD